jgi:hypothetical protein
MRTIADYETIYGAAYTEGRTAFDAEAQYGLWQGSVPIGRYSSAYFLAGTLSLYEATGKVAYFERALDWATAMVADATVTDSAGYANWPGAYHAWGDPAWTRPQGSGNGVSDQLSDFTAGVQLARVAAIGKTDSGLYVYSYDVNHVYNFVVTNLLEKWVGGRSDYWHAVVDSLTPTSWPQDDRWQSLMAIMAYLVTANPSLPVTSRPSASPNVGSTWLSRLSHLLALYRARFAAFGTRGLAWDIGREHYDTTVLAGDTSHSYTTPELLDALAGSPATTFTDADRVGVARLLLDTIWNRSTSDPKFANYINGTNTSYQGYGAWLNGTIYAGWPTLGRVYCPVNTAMDSALTAILTPGKFLHGTTNNSVYGRVCLAGHLARNVKSSTDRRLFLTA